MFLPMFERSMLADFGGRVQTAIVRKLLLYLDFCGHQRHGQTSVDAKLAERAGFEPAIPLRVCRISSAVLSTTQPPLRSRLT